MKNFVAIKTERNRSYDLTIYKVGPKGLTRVGYTSAQYGADRGEASEAFKWLVDNGHISKYKQRQIVKGGGRLDYYSWTYRDDYGINVQVL